MRDQLAFVIAQFAARALPDKTLAGIFYDPERRTMTVMLEGETTEEITLLVEATGGPSLN